MPPALDSTKWPQAPHFEAKINSHFNPNRQDIKRSMHIPYAKDAVLLIAPNRAETDDFASGVLSTHVSAGR
jgi:hypothetical protein